MMPKYILYFNMHNFSSLDTKEGNMRPTLAGILVPKYFQKGMHVFFCSKTLEKLFGICRSRPQQLKSIFDFPVPVLNTGKVI